MTRQHLQVMFGVPVDGVTMAGAVAAIDEAVARRSRLFISTPNLSFFTQSRANAMFRRSLFASDLSLVDGAPVLWLARMLGLAIPCRVPGSDLFNALRDRAPPGGQPLRVYFFGGPEGAAAEAAQRVNASAKGLRCVGWFYPGFRSVAEMSSPEAISAINQSGADLLVVALGAAKGQEWLLANRDAIEVPVRVHLGAVINFEAGRITRAPALFRKTGFEWLWRIKEEPQLFRRYAADFATLMSLALTGAVPAVWKRFTERRAPELAMKTQEAGEMLRVALSGNGGGDVACTLAPVAERAVASRKNVTLDCTGLAHIGPAALGQIAVLKGALQEAGLDLRFEGLSGQPRRACQEHGMDAILGIDRATRLARPQ